MLRRAEQVVVYNARVRDFVVSRGVDPGRVLLTHNGIDTGRFAPPPEESAEAVKAELRSRYGLPPGRPVALFVGRLVPKKGFDLVTAAASSRYTTLIVGEGAGSPPPAGPGVVFFGPATKDQLVDLYRLADVFVFPAVGEMFTLVMQEAMAAGLPVVTTDDPAYQAYGLDRERIGFVERDADAIRRMVTGILDSPERAAAMGRYSRRLAVERFSWEANYRREYAVYASGAGQPPEEVRLVPGLAG
jgi:glycosyltransferase involved in cell wall biosynthesis